MSTDGGINLPGLLADLVVATLFSADSLGTLPWVQALLAKGLGAGSAMSRECRRADNGALLVCSVCSSRPAQLGSLCLR